MDGFSGPLRARVVMLKAGPVLAVVGALLVSGCSGRDDPAVPASGSAVTSGTGDLGAYYGQRVSWGPCPVESGAAQSGSAAAAPTAECGTVMVPIDYADPATGEIAIALQRIPASGQAKGSLLVNPGGPGDSGVKFASSLVDKLPEEILSSYDLVGFDPRGVGGSAPLECADAAQLDAFIAADPTRQSEPEQSRAAEMLAAIGDGCTAGSGAVASHVTTVETAKDLDVLRAALGDDTLTYLGKSYGTFLGATYAALFPDRVGRMVLDGAVDPTLTQPAILLGQTAGFETALQAYADGCVASGECTVGKTAEEVVDTVRTLLADTDASPLPTSLPGRLLTQSLAYYGVTAALYSQELWPLLTQGLEYAAKGSGDGLILLADLYAQRGPDGYESNIFTANLAINCLDDRTKPAAPAIPLEEFTQASPTFGAIIAGQAEPGCTAWPLTTTITAPDYTADGAAPIVVVGTTRDPATPLAWSQALASMLSSGVLVTRDGDGHTGFLMGNTCVDDAVTRYLVDGTAPAAGTTC